ncbi:MAG: YbjN domain-containing protein [Actinomycetota bacterium]|nr:YbjN domain-containing protein [Actinomycetota bacterium]
MSTPQSVAGVIRAYLNANEIEFEEIAGPTLVVTLPGVKKLKTNVALTIGQHSVTVSAFVARCPEENFAGVHEWLLERNRRMYGVAFSIDHFGDIYLTGRVSLRSIDDEEVDRLLGAVLEYSDESFNPILEMGFLGAMQREWDWRISRGESTINLEAFRHLLEHPDA